MKRYTIVKVEDGILREYGVKFAIYVKNKNNKNLSNGIYIAQKVDKITDKRGKKINVLDKFVLYTDSINLNEQYELYKGLNPQIAKKYLFKPSDYGYYKITKEERNAILKCDEVNKEGMTDVYKMLHQRYIKFLLTDMNFRFKY